MTSPLRQMRRLARTFADRPDIQALMEPDESDTRDLVLQSLRAKNPTKRSPLDVAVAVAGTLALRSGLAWEWSQTDLVEDSWHDALTAEHVLLVVEVDGAAVAGWEAPGSALDLARAARELGIFSVAWSTGAAPPRDEIPTAYDAVFVADPVQADEGLPLLAPAAQPRAQSPIHDPRNVRHGSILIRDEACRDGASEVAPDGVGLLDALENTALVTHHWDLAEEGSPSPAKRLSAQYDVLADVGRRTPAGTWPVLDALASRTGVVTTQDRAEWLPAELRDVVSVGAPDDLRRHISVLALQPEVRDRQTHIAHRALLAGHTYADRAGELLSLVGRRPPPTPRTVSVVVPTNRPHELTNILENVGRQERVDTELILVSHGFDVDEPEIRARANDLGIDELTVVPAAADLTLGAVLNLGLDAASGAYIAKMDDDNFYGAQFLGDLVDAFGFTSAGVTGKWAHYVWLKSSGAVVLRNEKYEHAYNRLVQGGSIVARSDVALDIRFSEIPRAVDSDFLNRAMAAGVQTYSGDRYNYVSVRAHDRLSHTWKVDDLVFMVGAGRVVTYGDPRFLVSV